MANVNVMNMREAVRAMYPTAKGWSDKVDAMKPNQIIAIYHSNLERQARIAQRERELKKSLMLDEETPQHLSLEPRHKEEFHQMTLWELFSEFEK